MEVSREIVVNVTRHETHNNNVNLLDIPCEGAWTLLVCI